MGACKNCNKIFGAFDLDENKLCKECAKIVEIPKVQEITNVKDMQEIKSCSNLINCKTCHKEISKNAVSCPHCGEPLKNISDNSDNSDKKEKEPEKESGGSLFGTMIGLGCIAYVVLKIVGGGNDSSTTSSTSTSSSYKSSSNAITISECVRLREFINSPAYAGTEAQSKAMNKYSSNDCSSIEGEPTREKRLQEIRDAYKAY